jgi:hypothetical protein
MHAATWSAIGILTAGLFGFIFYFGSRLDAGFARLDTRMGEGFGRIDQRLDQVNGRLDAVSARLDAHIERHAG